MTSLQLISTKDLLVELCGRFNHAVFAGIIERPIEGQDIDVIRVTRIIGCRYIAQALASNLMIQANAENNARAERTSDEEL